MEFKLSDIENLFADIQNIIDYIEHTEYDERKSDIYLSNGDKFTYKLNKENIAHLLGINMDSLRATSCFKNTNSYELLKEFIDSPYKVNSLVQQGVLKLNQIFSEYIYEKVSIFNLNIKLNIYETELVCKYDVKKTYTLTDKNEKYDYVIVKKNKESYSILCLVKQNNYYVPMSSMYFENYDKLKVKLDDLIQNQEITVFSGIRTYNSLNGYDRTYILPADVKISKLTNLQQYKYEFNSIIDTTSDFKYLLTDSLKHKNQHFANYDLIQNAIASISTGNIIDVEPFLNSNLMGLVNAYNDYLCSHNSLDESTVGETYSKVVSERNKVKEELIKAREEIETLRNLNNEYIESNKSLQEENTHYKETETAILKLLKPSE